MKNSKTKKKIGENLYNYLIRNFPDSVIEEQINSLFLIPSDARELKETDFLKLKNLINTKLESGEKTKNKTTKTAKELLDEAGFILDDSIQEEEDYQKYKKYFASGEVLCKFNSYDATNRYKRLFFILRKNYKDLKREEFTNPTRQDEYGTSIMSVGISPDGRNIAQITNRYNHTVTGCDNTFGGNLDNIAEGLTEAFNNDYNLSLKKGQVIEFDNFYSYNSKFIYYFKEIDGKKIGNNTIDGQYYEPSLFYIFENYILNLKTKKIETIANNSSDDFIRIFNEYTDKGAKIIFTKKEKFENVEDREDTIYFFVD